MAFRVIAVPKPQQGRKKGKITCTTCQLKGCLGHCHFQAVADNPKAA